MALLKSTGNKKVNLDFNKEFINTFSEKIEDGNIEFINQTLKDLHEADVANLIENLNPGNGYFGAAITTFSCFLIMSILSYVIGQKHYSVNYEIKRILGYIILAVLLFLTSDFLISDLSIPVKLSINTLILAGYLGIAFKLERQQKINQ